MELVTLKNRDYSKPVKLTPSGLKLHAHLCEDDSYFMMKNDTFTPGDEWVSIGVKEEGGSLKEVGGVRIGSTQGYSDVASRSLRSSDGKYYDIYYTYKIENILENLDKLETKFK